MIIVMIGSYVNGEIGLKIWMSGLMVLLKVCDRFEVILSGMVMMVVMRKLRLIVISEVLIWLI